MFIICRYSYTQAPLITPGCKPPYFLFQVLSGGDCIIYLAANGGEEFEPNSFNEIQFFQNKEEYFLLPGYNICSTHHPRKKIDLTTVFIKNVCFI